MPRRLPLILAALGLVGLSAWYGRVLLIDHRLLGPIWAQMTARPIQVFMLIRLSLPFVVVLLGLASLIAAARRKSPAPWFLGLAFLLIAPLVVEGLPLRPTLVPYYLLFLFYLAGGLAIRYRAALGRPMVGGTPQTGPRSGSNDARTRSLTEE